MEINVNETSLPAAVVSNEKISNVIDFCNGIHNGIYTMSTKLENLVESSSNVGILDVNTDDIKVVTCVRSSENSKLEELTNEQKSLSSSLGFNSEDMVVAIAWPVHEDSNLAYLYSNSYKEVSGSDIKITATHGGLECGNFIGYNSNLDCICIGPTITSPHSTNETCDISQLPLTWKTLQKVLAEI